MKPKVAACLLLLGLTPAASAQRSSERDDPIGRNLFPPEIVMKHQLQIGLGEEQRNAIKKEIEKAQSRFLDLQWQMQEEAEKLELLLQGRPIDEAKVLAQADALMNLERETKKTHLSLLIRIKNRLTPEQQAKLQEIRQMLEKASPGRDGSKP